jgi:hypothetical protein
MTEHLISYVTLPRCICCGAATRPWRLQLHCPLLSVCLLGSTTVAIPLDDMVQRGKPTNILEERNFFGEEILKFLRIKQFSRIKNQ